VLYPALFGRLTPPLHLAPRLSTTAVTCHARWLCPCSPLSKMRGSPGGSPSSSCRGRGDSAHGDRTVQGPVLPPAARSSLEGDREPRQDFNRAERSPSKSREVCGSYASASDGAVAPSEILVHEERESGESLCDADPRARARAWSPDYRGKSLCVMLSCTVLLVAVAPLGPARTRV
jgi:hypothetical protein